MDEPVINEREQKNAEALTFKHTPIPEWWLKDNAFLTFTFNAISATVPHGERFIVNAVEAGSAFVTDKKLLKSAETLVHEETAHARMHDAYNKYLDSLNLPATKHALEIKALLDFFEKVFTLKMRLVTCTIIEHFTATYSKQILDIGILEGEDVDERMDRVWSWHAIEEMEHRSTAIDMYRAMGGGYFMRLYIGIFVSVAFAIIHTQCFLGFLSAKKILWSPSVWGKGLPYLFGTNGVYYLVFKYWLLYFKPGFHPTQIPILNRYDKQLHHYHIEDELVGYFENV